MDKSLGSATHERLCRRLKGLRIRAGITQCVLAERLDVRQAFVSEYERGVRRVDVLELRAIAAALGPAAAAVVAQLDALDAVLAALGEDAA